MAIATPSGNSALLNAQIANLIVQPLEQASTFLKAGPTIIDTSNHLRIPVISSGATANFYAPGSLISDGAVTFEEVDLLPDTLESLKVWVPLSNELIRESVIALDAVVEQRIVRDVAKALDAALWNGTGSNQVQGILQTSGVATGTLDLTTFDSLLNGISIAISNYVNPTHWVMDAASFIALRSLKVGTVDFPDNRYVYDPSTIQTGGLFEFFGLPVIVTSHVPANTVALLDISYVVVARDLDTQVQLFTETLGNYDAVAIRVVSRFDVALTQPEALTVLTPAS